MERQFKLIIGLWSLVFFSACGGQLQNLDLSSKGHTPITCLDAGCGQSADHELPVPNGWEKVNLNGQASGGTHNGSLVIYIDKQNQSVIFALPIPVLIPIFTEIPIPDLEGAALTTHTNSNGATSLAVRIPLKYLVKGGVFMPNERLPNGDRLPYVPSGELPGFAIQFPQMPSYRIHLYIGTSVAAVFAELPKLGIPYFGVSHWVVPVQNTANSQVIGAVGYVFPKNQYPGGAYLAAQLPRELAILIDELIRY